MLKKIIKRIDNYFLNQGVDNKEVRVLVRVQLYLLALLAAGSLLLGYGEKLPALSLGALLASFNFLVLARIVPKLIFVQKGAVFALLASFYSRLLLTALVLFLAIAWAKVEIVPLLTGLSTVIVTMLVWAGRFLVLHKTKEA